MCLCPDGTYANMVGDQIVCPSRAQAQPQVGAYSSNGGTCGVGYKCSWTPGKCVPEGKVDCGSYNCEPGYKCSSAKCISQDAVDCGSGHHCGAGQACTSVGCMPAGAVECGVGHHCNADLRCVQDQCVADTHTGQDETAAQRTIRAALDGCRMYVKASCDTALRSSAITEQDRHQRVGLAGVAERFERDQERCASGSVAACDAAIASPAGC